ncbi:MAG: flagellar basal body M-ring protein FliF [Gammaproteobacteria bacterium]|nr:flagellar basal body M-ring protein FliF [Gammaproteobacteria bacterium]
MATELVKADQLNASFQGMTQLPVVRQVGLLVGLAASIALGVYVVLWSRSPDYSVLYHQVSPRDTSEIVNVLQQQNIAFKVDTDSGLIMVDSKKVHEARMALAAQDLPHSYGDGFDLIEKDQGFGTSDFIQNARYQRALESELARTIMSISAVDNARVHLALPKESAFLADKRKPSASVFINLAPGRRLGDEQVSAIIHLVASSVPNMESNEVTLVDDKGHLLSRTDAGTGIGMSTRQLEYKHKVESQLANNIENILLPIVGPNKVRAQVVASMDFTQLEMTQESFDPDSPALRSEQRVEERSQGAGATGGVPGALSNQPPGAATAPQQANGTTTTTTTTTNGNQKSQVRYTINNELDRSIVHRRQSPGAIKRLSVAVVVDHKLVKNDKGELVSTAYTQEELNRFITLAKEAVGFDAMRGDSVNVINAEFSPPPTIEPAPPASFLDKPWVWDVGKQVLGGLLAALVLFGVLRPVMRNLSKIPPVREMAAGAGGDGLDEDQVTLTNEKGQRIPKPNEYESDLEMAKAMVIQEPKRVAQVVKQWVSEG